MTDRERRRPACPHCAAPLTPVDTHWCPDCGQPADMVRWRACFDRVHAQAAADSHADIDQYMRELGYVWAPPHE